MDERPEVSRVLVVEDDAEHRRLLSDNLARSDGYQVAGWADTAEGVLALARPTPPDVVLFDLQLRASWSDDSVSD